MTNVHVAGTSAVLVPGAARSATTDSAGFLERTALQARHRIRDRGSDGCRNDWCSGYELSVMLTLG